MEQYPDKLYKLNVILATHTRPLYRRFLVMCKAYDRVPRGRPCHFSWLALARLGVGARFLVPLRSLHDNSNRSSVQQHVQHVPAGAPRGSIDAFFPCRSGLTQVPLLVPPCSQCAMMAPSVTSIGSVPMLVLPLLIMMAPVFRLP